MKLNLSSFNLGVAKLKIVKDNFKQLGKLILLDCNEEFLKLTNLNKFIGKCIIDYAFEKYSETYFHDYFNFLNCNSNGKLMHYFFPTKKWLYLILIKDEDKNEIELICFDLTDFQTNYEKLKLKEKGYRNFVEHSHGIAFQRIIKPESKAQTLFAAGSFNKMLGYTNEIGKSTKTWLEIVHPDDIEWVTKESESLIHKNGYYNQFEYRVIKANGEVAWVRTYDSNFRSDDDKYQIIQGLKFDITAYKMQELELKKANKLIKNQNRQLEHLSNFDFLTDIFSRRNIEILINRLVDEYPYSLDTFSLMLIDLDYFKSINDTYGHSAGDFVLKEFARVIKNQLRKGDFFGRWGGEEFVVIFSKTKLDEGFRIAEMLLKSIREHTFYFAKNEIKITFTAGIKNYSGELTFLEFYNQVDKALYDGKKISRNTIIKA